jgi:hypothetical protein
MTIPTTVAAKTIEIDTVRDHLIAKLLWDLGQACGSHEDQDNHD